MATGSYPIKADEPTPEELAMSAAWDRTRRELPPLLAAGADTAWKQALLVVVADQALEIQRLSAAVDILGAQALADADLHAIAPTT